MRQFTDTRIVPLSEHPDRDDILIAADTILDRMIARANKTWTQSIDKEQALNAFFGLYQGQHPYGLNAVVVNNSHVLIYQIGSVWYNPLTPIVLVQLYVRVNKGSGKEALAAVKSLAQEEGAAGVIMATSFAKNDPALGRLLAQEGYAPMSQQHFLGVN